MTTSSLPKKLTDSPSSQSNSGQFPDTRWTLVVSARNEDSPEGAKALAELCELYWSPLYFFVRRRGYPAEEAKDLTQDFFRQLLEKRNLVLAEESRGKLRTFLISSLKNFLADQWDRSQAKKRGGGTPILSIDQISAEERYRVEPQDDLSPDVLFDKQWARIVLDSVMEKLRDEHVRSGTLDAFEVLHPHLGWHAAESTYTDTADRLGVSENAARLRVMRLRRRYGDLLRACISETVSGEEELMSEMAYLRSVVAS